MSDTQNEINDDIDCNHDFGPVEKRMRQDETDRVVIQQEVKVRECKKCDDVFELDEIPDDADVNASQNDGHSVETENETYDRSTHPTESADDAVILGESNETTEETQSTTDEEATPEEIEEKFFSEATKPSSSVSKPARVLVCDYCMNALLYNEQEILNEYDNCPECDEGELHIFQEV